MQSSRTQPYDRSKTRYIIKHVHQRTPNQQTHRPHHCPRRNRRTKKSHGRRDTKEKVGKIGE